jgi:hypothetical protein
MTRHKFRVYQEQEFKDILMCMVTAGADVFTSNWERRTVSQFACIHGHEEIWREVLSECGYDPDTVFRLENDFWSRLPLFWPGTRSKIAAENVFSTTAPVVRPTKLSFKEYSRQRRSLECVQKVYSSEEIDIQDLWRERDEFWGSILEGSDSEDYESVSSEEDFADDRYDETENGECGSANRVYGVGKDYSSEHEDFMSQNNGDEARGIREQHNTWTASYVDHRPVVERQNITSIPGTQMIRHRQRTPSSELKIWPSESRKLSLGTRSGCSCPLHTGETAERRLSDDDLEAWTPNCGPATVVRNI